MFWLGLVITLVAAWAVFAYNRLVRSRNEVEEAWSGIDVQLMRRHDLIPQLVSTTNAYKNYEKETLALNTLLRSAGQNNRPSAQETLEQGINEQLSRILVLQEDYPELKADQHFIELMQNLADTEDKLQYARRYYNGCVRVLNTRIQQIPDALIARLFNFEEAEFFELEAVEMASNVLVKLDG
jgi:LemA protein